MTNPDHTGTPAVTDYATVHLVFELSRATWKLGLLVAIELAWLWVQHRPESELTRWFHKRVGNLKGRPRRVAIVALARKLMVALWRYLTTGLIPTGAVMRPSL
jgi:transposase